MFNSQADYLKDPRIYQSLGVNNSLISICDPKLHKIHRSVVNPLFAKASIDRLIPTVVGKVEDAAEVIRQCSERGEPVNIQMLYRCITVSQISGVSSAEYGPVHGLCLPIPKPSPEANLHTVRLTLSQSPCSASLKIFLDATTRRNLFLTA